MEPSALMKSAAAWACWMPVPLMRKTFLRLPLSRSAELAAGMSIGMLAFSKIVRVGSVAPGAVAPDRDVDLRGDQLGGAGRGSLRVAGLVLDGQAELAPVDATGGVDLVDGHLGAVLRYGPMAAEEPLRGVSMPSLMSPAEPESELDEEPRRPPPQAASPRVSVAAARGASAPDRVGHDVPLPANTVAIVLHPGRMSRSPHRSAHTALCDIAPNPREWRWPCHALWCSRDRAVTGIGPRARTRQERGRSGRAGTAQCP